MFHLVLASLSEREKAVLMELDCQPLRLACYLPFCVVQREILPSAYQSVPDCVDFSPALATGHSSDIYLECEMIRPSSGDATLVPHKRHFVIRRLPFTAWVSAVWQITRRTRSRTPNRWSASSTFSPSDSQYHRPNLITIQPQTAHHRMYAPFAASALRSGQLHTPT